VPVLLRIVPGDRGAAEALLTVLDADEGCASLAGDALGLLGPHGKAVVPLSAARALRRVDPEAAKAAGVR
jgi:hypothetical protein